MSMHILQVVKFSKFSWLLSASLEDKPFEEARQKRGQES